MGRQWHGPRWGATGSAQPPARSEMQRDEILRADPVFSPSGLKEQSWTRQWSGKKQSHDEANGKKIFPRPETILQAAGAGKNTAKLLRKQCKIQTVQAVKTSHLQSYFQTK